MPFDAPLLSAITEHAKTTAADLPRGVGQERSASDADADHPVPVAPSTASASEAPNHRK